MTGTQATGLKLQLIDYERQPEYPIDCLEFGAAASIRKFHGRTRFSIYKRDLEAFLDELDEILASLSGEASVRAGRGRSVFFEMKARFFEKLGHIAVELELADRGPRERMQKLLVEFRTEPALLQEFISGLRRAAERGDTAPVQLVGIDA